MSWTTSVKSSEFICPHWRSNPKVPAFWIFLSAQNHPHTNYSCNSIHISFPPSKKCRGHRMTPLLLLSLLFFKFPRPHLHPAPRGWETFRKIFLRHTWHGIEVPLPADLVATHNITTLGTFITHLIDICFSTAPAKSSFQSSLQIFAAICMVCVVCCFVLHTKFSVRALFQYCIESAQSRFFPRYETWMANPMNCHPERTQRCNVWFCGINKIYKNDWHVCSCMMVFRNEMISDFKLAILAVMWASDATQAAILSRASNQNLGSLRNQMTMLGFTHATPSTHVCDLTWIWSLVSVVRIFSHPRRCVGEP